ncbi:MAG: histidine kinase [Sphaerochaetaceae bacterium]|nr:histidine kinase [Sphaerochaetaceae bacterium]
MRIIKATLKGKSISTRMIFTMGFAFIILLLCSTIFYSYALRQEVLATVSADTQKLVDSSLSSFHNLKNSVSSISFYVSGDQVLKNLLTDYPEDSVEVLLRKNEIRDYLLQLWISRPEIVGVLIYVDKEKNISSDSIGVSSTSFIEDNGWVETLGAQKGKILKSDTLFQRGNNQFNFFSLIKIEDSAKNLLGYLSFEISPEKLYSKCLEPNLATDGSLIYAINGADRVVCGPDLSEIGMPVEEILNIEDLESLLNSNTARIDGQQFLIVHNFDSSDEWNIIELIPVDDVLDMKRIALINFLMLAVVFSILSLITVIITKSINRPIVQLCDAMSSDSPHSEELVNSHPGLCIEVDRLYESFSGMQRTINNLLHKQQKFMDEQRLSEIKALRAQINPHFMYNSLDYLNWKAQDFNAPEISNMLTLLSRFMRISLSSSKLICPLRSEIDHVKTYLEIFKVRTGSNFSYSIECDKTILDCQVPQFMLQPLVENSIIHGFGKHLNGAEISIDIRRVGERIVFDVKDNGSGMDEITLLNALKAPQDKTGEQDGYGLKNISQRLTYICKDENFSGFTLRSVEKGTCIHFEINERVLGKEYE